MSCRALQITRLMALLSVLSAAGPAYTQMSVQQRAASIRNLLPAANTQLRNDDVPPRQAGAERVCVSPTHEPGSSNTHSVPATCQTKNYTTITRTRKVPVKAGQQLEVYLRQMD